MATEINNFEFPVLDDSRILKNYNEAKNIYAEWGIDTDKIVDLLSGVSISMHCWQGDDVDGFEKTGNQLSLLMCR